MSRISALLLTATLFAVGTPALAADECSSGYKTFVNEMASLSKVTSGFEFAEAQRKGLSVYDSCRAGDALSTQGSWGLILKEIGDRADKADQ